jgi:hypothetical protein
MSFNWTSVGNTLSGITTALTAAGVTSTSIPGIMASIGLAANPNQAEEQALCSQIMIASGDPTLAAALATKLATEAGIPPAAATIAMTLGQPGVDIIGRVAEIEAIITKGS